MMMSLSKRRAPFAALMISSGVVYNLVVVVLFLLVMPYRAEMKYLGPKLSHLAVDDLTSNVFVGGKQSVR